MVKEYPKQCTFFLELNNTIRRYQQSKISVTLRFSKLIAFFHFTILRKINAEAAQSNFITINPMDSKIWRFQKNRLGSITIEQNFAFLHRCFKL